MLTPRTWVEAGNDPQTDFPIQNLPFGVFSRASGEGRSGIGVAIGDRILDLRLCRDAGLLDPLPRAIVESCDAESLNGLMALGREAASALRDRVAQLLLADAPGGHHDRLRTDPCLVPMDSALLELPAAIGDYTDFYASVHHAANVGRLFRPDRPLPSNYRHVPLAYHGRASSIIVSGHPVRRPHGQSNPTGGDAPQLGPTASLDYEVEVGFFIGPGNALGEAIPIDRAESAIFGVCLVNDWSARDVQAWESQPLGPFLSKSFATTISPWVVSMDALAPFRGPAFERASGDPAPLPYLLSASNQQRGGLDITLEVSILTAKMRTKGLAALRLGRSQFRDQYWTAAQLVTHHASNGCNLRPGDLLASGTVSGPSSDAHGCLLELTRRGTEPILLPTGERRTFLEDGDDVIVRGYCQREGHARIGFGECRGRILEALPTP